MYNVCGCIILLINILTLLAATQTTNNIFYLFTSSVKTRIFLHIIDTASLSMCLKTFTWLHLVIKRCNKCDTYLDIHCIS